MNWHKRVAIPLFIIALILFASFIRQTVQVFNAVELEGQLSNISCVTKGRLDKLSFSIIRDKNAHSFTVLGFPCFDFREFEQQEGKIALISKTKYSNTVLSIKSEGKIYLSRIKKEFVSNLGALLIIGMFFGPGLVLWKEGEKRQRINGHAS